MAVKTSCCIIKSDVIQDWIEKEGISQEWLSKTLGRSRTYVNYCLHSGTMNKECVRKIAELMGETEFSLTTTLEERYKYYHPELFTTALIENKADSTPITTAEEFAGEPVKENPSPSTVRIIEEPIQREVVAEKTQSIPWAELNQWLASYIAQGQFAVPVSDLLSKLGELQARSN